MSWFSNLWDKLNGKEQEAPVAIEEESRPVQQEMTRPVLAQDSSDERRWDLETARGTAADVAWKPAEPNAAPVRKPRTRLTKAEADSAKKPRKQRKDKGVKRGPRKAKPDA